MLLSELLKSIDKYEINNDRLLRQYSYLDIEDISSDSRTARCRIVFVCIQGTNFDGHTFASDAAERGVRVIIAERMPENLKSNVLVIKVDNSRRAYALMCGKFFSHPDARMRVIGITGTKGKTTTAIMIKNILDQSGVACGYIGTNGIMYGDECYDCCNTTPDIKLIYRYLSDMLSKKIKNVVIEISSQALWQSRVLGIDFDICIFTNISHDHIGGIEHPNFEHYKACKESLFTEYGARQIIYNADDSTFAPVFKKCVGATLFPYSIKGKCGLYAENIESFREGDSLGVECDCRKLKSDGSGEISSFRLKLNAPGEFSVYNALAATVCARLIGVPTASIQAALENTHIGGRFEALSLRSKPKVTFIIDYAHNAVSLREAISTLAMYPHNRLIVLFGSVGGRTFGRRAELGRVAAEMADFSVLTADNPDYEPVQAITEEIRREFKKCEADDKCVEIPDREAAIRYVYDIAKDGDIVLLAGKGHEKYQLIFGKRVPFSEREILREIDNAYSVATPI